MQILNDSDLKLLKESTYMKYSTGIYKYSYAPAYLLIADTGLRSGEALSLTWDKVNFQNKTLIVCQNASRVKNMNSADFKGSKQIIKRIKRKSGYRSISLIKITF